MNLSEIMSLPEDQVEDVYYDVEVDSSDYFTPPTNLKAMSICARFADDGRLLDELVDIIVSFSLSGVNIVLDVAFEDAVRFKETSINGFVFEKYIIQLAANASAVVSLLPPKDESETNKSLYLDSLSRFTDAFLNQGNLSRLVYPVSLHLESMYLEVVSSQKAEPVVDEYVHKNFVEAVSDDFDCAIQNKIKEVVFAAFGGEDQFRVFTLNTMSKIIDRVENIAKHSNFTASDVQYIQENIVDPSREKRDSFSNKDES